MNQLATRSSSPTYSIVSVVAIVAAVISLFIHNPLLGLIFSIVAIICGVLGGILALLPQTRGGIISILSIVAGVIGIIVAIFRILGHMVG